MKEWSREILILVAVFLTSSLLGKLLLDRHSERQIEADLSYEMPRPESYRGRFSLDGRELEEQILNQANEHVSKVEVKTTAKPDTKKTNAKNEKKKQKKTTADKKKKPSVSISVTDTQGSMKMRLADLSDLQNQNVPGPASAGKSSAPTTPKSENKEKEDKKDSIDWRSLLFDQPDTKNGADFLAAYRRGDVERAAFFALAEELFKDGNSARQSLGLYLLKSSPSLESYSAFVNHMQKISESERSAFRTENLKVFSQPIYFSIVATVLNSKSKELVTEGLRSVQGAIENATSTEQTPNRDPRSIRSITPGGPESKAQLTIFISGLSGLSQDEDPSIAAEAQQLLNAIKSLLNQQEAS